MRNVKVFMVMVMVVVMGFATHAIAGKGKGRGDGWQNCPAYKSLSAEDQQKVKAEIDAFRTGNQATRDQIRQKRQELKTEMAKSQPDVQKASALQKEISDLNAQIAQKRIQHIANLKNINPSLSDCFKRGKGGKGKRLPDQEENQ